MLYALIPNIPLINVHVRPIKPNKLVMLYDKKLGEIDHFKNKKVLNGGNQVISLARNVGYVLMIVREQSDLANT